MVRWVIGSIPHGGLIELFLSPVNAHDWCYKGCGMCYPVCEMVHIKTPLLLISKSNPCGGGGSPLLLYDLRHLTVNKNVCISK